MTLGRRSKQVDLLDPVEHHCQSLPETSLFRVLHKRGDELFGDDMFADLFANIGRHSVSPRIVATLMVLQRFSGLSDREAVERLQFDTRWMFACGVPLHFGSFSHVVLVQMRARLAKSARPERVFEVVKEVARASGFIGRKRVLDSTALYDAVSTQDTVTLVHDAIRLVLKELTDEEKSEVVPTLARSDDYKESGKPKCNWDNREAREQLVHDLAADGEKVLISLENYALPKPLMEAVELLVAVLGQDIELVDGRYRIVREVAPNRVISTVDPEARHGHKTASRHFDGYKAHIAADPDSEIITAIDVTPGNVSDGVAVESLLREELNEAANQAENGVTQAPIEVYGDSSYGGADTLECLEKAGIEANVKVQPAVNREGMHTLDEFAIDLENKTATCPAGRTIQLRVLPSGEMQGNFGVLCKRCPQFATCTQAKSGRAVRIHPKFGRISRYRTRQRSEEWKAKYRSTRPKIERKIAHLMRHRHGGRRARVRGTTRVRQDFSFLAAAVNLVRIAKLQTAQVSVG